MELEVCTTESALKFGSVVEGVYGVCCMKVTGTFILNLEVVLFM